MAIKYINHLRENNKNLCSPEAAASFKNLTFGGQILDNGLKMNTLSSINLNQFKEESEQSNASLQSSLQNSVNLSKKSLQFDTLADDYLNGVRDCCAEVFKFLATTPLLQSAPTAKAEQLIIDLKAHLDANLIKQEPHNSVAGKRRVDFSPKSSNSIQSVDGLQIKLEEMDVEESSCRARKQEKLNFEDKFNGSKLSSYCGGLPASKSLNAPSGLNLTCKPNEVDKHLLSRLPSALSSTTLKNYLTNNDLLKTDYLKSNCYGNLDLELNPSIKSRSLTSSPNSSNLTDGGYKFKSSIKEKFDAESNLKVCRSEHLGDHNAMSRPRSATVGANASSIRRLNPIALDLKEKIGNSIAELNAAAVYESSGRLDGKSPDVRLSLGQHPLQHPPPLPKSSLVKKTSPGFVLHPNQPYYVPIEIDLSNLMTHFTKPNQPHADELLSQMQSSIQHLSGKAVNACSSFLTATNGSQNSLNQYSEHLSYSSPSLNSLNSLHNSSFATGYLQNLQNASLKCCLDDGKLAEAADHSGVIHYPIMISVNFRFPPLSLSAILNAQNSQKSS